MLKREGRAGAWSAVTCQLVEIKPHLHGYRFVQSYALAKSITFSDDTGGCPGVATHHGAVFNSAFAASLPAARKTSAAVSTTSATFLQATVAVGLYPRETVAAEAPCCVAWVSDKTRWCMARLREGYLKSSTVTSISQSDPQMMGPVVSPHWDSMHGGVCSTTKKTDSNVIWGFTHGVLQFLILFCYCTTQTSCRDIRADVEY